MRISRSGTAVDSDPRWAVICIRGRTDFSLAGSAHRIMVRTCNGLELRDPALYAEASASELVDQSNGDLYCGDKFSPRELEAIALGSSCKIHGTPPLPPLCAESAAFLENAQEAPPFLGEIPFRFAQTNILFLQTETLAGYAQRGNKWQAQ